MAGELGFEPRFSESESDVLPLNYSPTREAAGVCAACRRAVVSREINPVLERTPVRWRPKRHHLGHLGGLSKSGLLARDTVA